jgi:hypothetical protein
MESEGRQMAVLDIVRKKIPPKKIYIKELKKTTNKGLPGQPGETFRKAWPALSQQTQYSCHRYR